MPRERCRSYRIAFRILHDCKLPNLWSGAISNSAIDPALWLICGSVQIPTNANAPAIGAAQTRNAFDLRSHRQRIFLRAASLPGAPRPTPTSRPRRQPFRRITIIIRIGRSFPGPVKIMGSSRRHEGSRKYIHLVSPRASGLRAPTTAGPGGKATGEVSMRVLVNHESSQLRRSLFLARIMQARRVSQR